MKYLMKDINGLYDKDGIIIDTHKDKLSTYDLILKYGFALSEITNKKILINKVLISNDISTSTIKYNNQEAYIIINDNFDRYNNIIFNSQCFSVLVSNDGKKWRLMLDKDGYLENEFNISLTTLNKSKMTLDEYDEFTKMRKFIDKYSKPINFINNNNFIKYIIIKLNTEELNAMYSKINLINHSIKKDDDIPINYTKDKITITNDKGTSIKTLNVKLNLNEYVKNTISEF